ncbi:uncharacterized protein LOC130997990 [Salvia miltiorrhiza]|uniref:uncharacterized protein LOC130997990 n=1 Tax=Salvia miltiorrhiza TaxID=226208 RepID=UPI0025ACFDAF|nr:uncharacterized protein LOC130997990 [Salvia miltiorrhiza]
MNDEEKWRAAIWKSPAPQKAIVTAWRLMRNRLPTCDNLRKRSIDLGEEESKCSECKLLPESTNHLFLRCPKIEEVWNELQKWLGVEMVRPQRVESHFGTFSCFGKEKKIIKLLSAIWVCCVWILWKKRNEKRFERMEWESKNIVTEIKIRTWCWNKIFGIVGKEMDLSCWCSNELIKTVL